MKKIVVIFVMAAMHQLHAMDKSLTDWFEIPAIGAPHQTMRLASSGIPSDAGDHQALQQTDNQPTDNQPSPVLECLSPIIATDATTDGIPPAVHIQIAENSENNPEQQFIPTAQKWYQTKSGKLSLVAGTVTCIGVGTIAIAYQIFKK